MGQPSFSDCERIRAVISAALDGEVSEVEQATANAHVDACPACRAFAEGLEETSRLLGTTPLEELSFPIVLPSHRLRLARTMQLGATAAAVAATVFFSVTVGTSPNGGGLTSLSPAANASAAYLQSPEYELRMLQRASAATPLRAHYAV